MQQALLASAIAGALLALLISIWFLYRRLLHTIEKQEMIMQDVVQPLRRDSNGMLRILRTQAESESARTELLADSVAKAVAGSLNLSSDLPDSLLVLREISHSLNTPLQHIDLTLRRMRPLVDARMQDDLYRTLIAAEHSVNLCRAVVNAYRDLVAITGATVAESINDLQGSLVASAEIFQIRLHGKADPKSVAVESPSRIPGYGNYFVMSLAIPILQNAVEAAPFGSPIKCSLTLSQGYCSLEVVNFSKSRRLDLEKMEKSGFSTKGEGHEGLGLSSVRTLLSRTGGDLTFALDDDRKLHTVVRLPVKEQK